MTILKCFGAPAFATIFTYNCFTACDTWTYHPFWRIVNYWFSYCLDLFGSEVSTNASDWFAAGLKGRFWEEKKYSEHTALGQHKTMAMPKNGKLVDEDVALVEEVVRLVADRLLVDDRLVIEIKALDQVHPVHKAQLLSYLRLGNYPIGLLLNFHTEVLKNGIIRMVN